MKGFGKCPTLTLIIRLVKIDHGREGGGQAGREGRRQAGREGGRG